MSSSFYENSRIVKIRNCKVGLNFIEKNMGKRLSKIRPNIPVMTILFIGNKFNKSNKPV